jgi:glycerol uptake facilitator-like aquaporin
MSLSKKCFAEFLGTFALVFAGTGAIIINQASGGAITHAGIAITFGLVLGALLAVPACCGIREPGCCRAITNK